MLTSMNVYEVAIRAFYRSYRTRYWHIDEVKALRAVVDAVVDRCSQVARPADAERIRRLKRRKSSGKDGGR